MQTPFPVPASRAELIELLTSAIQQHEAGRLIDAEDTYRRLLTILPDCTEIHFSLGNTLKRLNRLEEAALCFDQALRCKSDFAEAWNNLGTIRLDQRDFDKAATCFQRALSIKPDYAEAHNNLGIVRMERRMFDEAKSHLKLALKLKPNYAEAHNNLGIVQMERGELSEAAAHYSQACQLKPDYAEARYNLAEVISFRENRAMLHEFEKLPHNLSSFPEDKRLYIHFACAKALDEVGDHARAFDQMLAGNAVKRQQIQYDEEGTLGAFKRIADVFQPELLSRFRKAPETSRNLIFILGMPRSGSTLIEQILTSHPDVYGAGEIDAMDVVARGAQGQYPESILNLDAASFGCLAEQYLSLLPPIPQGKSWVTDKRPLNFLHIGLIHVIFPDARIIHTVRAPVDTCLSCFSKLFTFDMHFTYDLQELGRYYRHYQDLMSYWTSVLPYGTILDVKYEQVVDDLEGQARRLLEYCRLPWDDRCLDFHKNARPVTTASAVQVRQPVYRKSVRRSDGYRPFLNPLLNELNIATSFGKHASAVAPPAPHFPITGLNASGETGRVHQRRSLHPFA